MSEKKLPKTVEEAQSLILQEVYEESKQCLVTRRRDLRFVNGFIAVEIDERGYAGIPERMFFVSALDQMISDGLFVELMKDASGTTFEETYQMTAKGIELAEKRRFKREVKAQQTPSD